MNVEEKIKDKLLEKLDLWCNHFMLIGTMSETPRYSQILKDYENDKYSLQSTVTSVYYDVEFTKEEEQVLDKMQHKGELWNWWKQIRTKHIATKYPTIKAY